MKILFLSRWFPIPTDNGSKLRIYNLLRGLAKHHEVTLLSFIDQADPEFDLQEIRLLCSDVKVVPWREFNPTSQRARIGFLSPIPRFLLDTHSSQMAEMIQNSIASQQYDLVVASQLSMAAYFPFFPDTPAIFDEIEIGIFYGQTNVAKNPFRRFRLFLTWFKLRNFLLRALDHFSAGTVVSEQERDLLIRQIPQHSKKIGVIPNCINFDEYQIVDIQPVPAQLIYTGSFRFNANYEAMQWFVRDVFPKILEKAPKTQLVITGDHADLPFPSAPNVTLAGYIEDIKSLVASSRISIAPLLTGGGTRLKILEAMAIGTPVVATTKGAEGLDVTSGEHLLVADSAGEFADCIIALLNEDVLHDKLSKNGKLFVNEKHDWKTAMPRFLDLVERIVDIPGKK